MANQALGNPSETDLQMSGKCQADRDRSTSRRPICVSSETDLPHRIASPQPMANTQQPQGHAATTSLQRVPSSFVPLENLLKLLFKKTAKACSLLFVLESLFAHIWNQNPGANPMFSQECVVSSRTVCLQQVTTTFFHRDCL